MQSNEKEREFLVERMAVMKDDRYWALQIWMALEASFNKENKNVIIWALKKGNEMTR